MIVHLKVTKIKAHIIGTRWKAQSPVNLKLAFSFDVVFFATQVNSLKSQLIAIKCIKSNPE